MTKFWSYQQRASHTDLYILTEIAGQESWWSDTTTPKAFRRELMECKGEIHLWLDSPGGDAFAGAAIYDMLREYSASGRGKVVAMVSLAASAASLIAMGCDEIRISIVGTMMIHEPWSLTAGNEKELMAVAETLAKIRNAQIDAYARRTGNSRERILELMEGADGHGTYMNANEAVEYGFADKIIDEGTTMRSALQSMRVASCVSDARRFITQLANIPKPGMKDEPEEPEPADDEGEPVANARAELMRSVAVSY